MDRIDNFNAGPSALPLSVLTRAQKELTNYQGTGMSVLEMSHRSRVYEEIHGAVEARLRKLLKVNDDYSVLFLQGGASLQFAMVPMNFLHKDKQALYVLTGAWSEKALKEAKQFGDVEVNETAKTTGYKTIPKVYGNTAGVEPAFIHVTSNNTIYGTQWHEFPQTSSRLVVDMSSDILSREVDVNQFDLIYAGAQKNLGPSGVTVVIVKNDWLEESRTDIPTMLAYQTHAKSGSMYNTPPTFAIYLMGLVLEWVEETGGVSALELRNREKAGLIYDVIDKYPSFYEGHAETDARSFMNVTFRLPSDEVSKQFLDEATDRNFVGVKGHRSVGGCRVSLYNAVPHDAAQRFAKFMDEFAQKHRQ